MSLVANIHAVQHAHGPIGLCNTCLAQAWRLSALGKKCGRQYVWGRRQCRGVIVDYDSALGEIHWHDYFSRDRKNNRSRLWQPRINIDDFLALRSFRDWQSHTRASMTDELLKTVGNGPDTPGRSTALAALSLLSAL